MRILNRIWCLQRNRFGFSKINLEVQQSILFQNIKNKGNVYLVYKKTYSNESKGKSKAITENPLYEETAVQTTIVERVKDTTINITYLLIIIGSIGIASGIIYAIFSELFSSNSPNNVYSKTVDYVSKDPRVLNVIGDQIKAYGEETRRGRRQHVSHVEYTKDGVNLLRMKFYVKGSRETGSVHLEMIENENGKYDYRYLFVITDGLLRKTVILEDNRYKYDKSVQVSYPEINSDSFNEFDLSSK